MHPPRFWNGPNVHVALTSPTHDRRTVEVGLTPDLAGELANLLRKATALGEPPASLRIVELLNGLDYVLVADPASVAAHRRLEASKGMEPAGADPRTYLERVQEFPDAKTSYVIPERQNVWRQRGFDSKAQMQEFEARPGFPGWEML